MLGNLWTLLISVAKTFGIEALRRFLTMPESTIRSICAKTGADPEKAIEERGKAVDADVKFIESMIDADFSPDELLTS